MVNSTIYLFVGLSFSILGVVFLVYTFILWIQERKERGRGIRDAVASSLEFEQLLPPQSLNTTEPTPLTTSNPYERLSPTPPVPNVPTMPNKVVPSTPAIEPTESIPTQQFENTYDREQLVTALETLIQHRSLGIIDEETYNKRKGELLHHPEAPRRSIDDKGETTNSNHDDQDTKIDELLIDYMEGIISPTEYERRKSQITNKSS